MAEQAIEGPPAGQSLLAQILRAVRRRRGLTATDVASAMKMPRRSYEHFESGVGLLNVARVHQFAKAADADGHAILAALHFRSPAFALRCIDNKLMTIMMMAAQEFDGEARDDIVRLDARSLITAFTQVFGDLTAKAREVDSYIERWMSDKSLHGPPDDAEGGDV